MKIHVEAKITHRFTIGITEYKKLNKSMKKFGNVSLKGIKFRPIDVNVSVFPLSSGRYYEMKILGYSDEKDFRKK